MNDKWRYTTTSITKYNPIFRDENGIFKKIEWIGFFQIGQLFDGVKLTFEPKFCSRISYARLT